MKNSVYDVIVIGAGFSGLSASYHLKQRGLRHVIFERGRIGETWRSQRWDHFMLNSTNKLNLLPGMVCETDPDGFEPAPAFVSTLDKYVIEHQLPVYENARVVAVEKENELFRVTVLRNGAAGIYFSRQVLIASGWANEVKIPALSNNLSPRVRQYHTAEYRNANQLPHGAVLVVGSAQSGIQIAEDLVNAGRKVYLSTSEVGRMPRWYRGRDIFYWLKDMKYYDISEDEVTDPKILTMRSPQVTGTGSGRDTVSLQALAKKGAVILGSMQGADGHQVYFKPDAADHVRYADTMSAHLKELIDDYIEQNHIPAPPAHEDIADTPDPEAACASNVLDLDLEARGIRTIIWSTGFTADYSYIKLPVFDSQGKLKHRKGIPKSPGLYFLGYPWLRTKKSSILFGILEDVEIVVNAICEHALEPSTP